MTETQQIIEHLETLIELSLWAVRAVFFVAGVLLFRFVSLRSTV